MTPSLLHEHLSLKRALARCYTRAGSVQPVPGSISLTRDLTSGMFWFHVLRFEQWQNEIKKFLSESTKAAWTQQLVPLALSVSAKSKQSSVDPTARSLLPGFPQSIPLRLWGFAICRSSPLPRLRTYGRRRLDSYSQPSLGEKHSFGRASLPNFGVGQGRACFEHRAGHQDR